ncbi:MAG: glycosyltransferase family 39 protein [Candidatus Brocadiales bacterium]|nr:glycosyltransferase family 39 protein [Candidatus Bathyanammoxibius sp.]
MRDVLQGNGRTAVLILTALWLAIYFPNLWVREFVGTDEPLYAQVGREVLLDGHWFALTHNGALYCNKPPLYFWIEAILSLPQGDVTEFTAILPSMLSALGTVLLVYFLGRRLFNHRAGLLAALIMLTMPQFHKYGCQARLDVPFSFFITASLTAFYYGYTGTGRRKTYILMAWVFMTLAAMITKGPITFIMVGGVVVSFLWWRNDLKFLKETQPLVGGLLLVAIHLVWLIPAYNSGGWEYIDGIIGHFMYHARTPLGIDKFFFYFSNIFQGTMPWSLVLPGAVYFYARKTTGESRGTEFAGMWLLVMIVIFSIILQKFSRYVLPAYPGMALLLGSFWDELMEKPPLKGWPANRPVITYGLAVFVGFMVAWIFVKAHTHQFHPSPLVISLIAAAVIGLAGTLWYTFKSKQFRVLFIFILLLTGTFLAVCGRYMYLFDNKDRSEKTMCLKISSLMEPGTPWAVYNLYRPAQTFYTNTHPKRVSSQDKVVTFLNGTEKVYCLIQESEFQTLASKTDGPLYAIEKIQGPKRKMKNLLLISNKPEKSSLSP